MNINILRASPIPPEKGLLLRNKEEDTFSWEENCEAMAAEKENWDDFDAVVVVSQDEMNRQLDTVVVCPLTPRLHPRWRSRLQIRRAGQDAEIAVSQIRTISRQRLKQRIDRLCDETAAILRRLITDMYGE